MRLLFSPSNDPYFNLAAEEYYFKNSSDDMLFLYVNTPAIVIGKHQNAMAEINYNFVKENQVKVVRRISGGGAVYHDLGNLNFSFHKAVDDPSKISFKTFNKPIVEVLNSMNIPAEISNRNDIKVNGFKVSGHAEHVFRKRILSHGTLLFNSKKEDLSKALKSKENQFVGKAIKSVRSKIANITDFLKDEVSLTNFTQKIISFFETQMDAVVVTIQPDEQEQIANLVAEKYQTWKWNFGYSPKFTYSNEIEIDLNILNCELEVIKGTITKVKLAGTWKDEKTLNIIANELSGLHHNEKSIANALQNSAIALAHDQIQKIITLFF